MKVSLNGSCASSRGSHCVERSKKVTTKDAKSAKDLMDRSESEFLNLRLSSNPTRNSGQPDNASRLRGRRHFSLVQPGDASNTDVVLQTILLLTKGILRDQKMRRLMMFWVMLAALILLFLGSWLLSDKWAREHPWLYIGFWAVCGWLTITGMLLALLDMLALRAAQRAARRVLEKQMVDEVKKKE